MDSIKSNFPPPPSATSTDSQAETKVNPTLSSGHVNPNADVKSVISDDASTNASHVNSNLPNTTAATSAAFINATTAAPSPPISISYPSGVQNGIGGSNVIPNTESNVPITQKHVLPPPSTSSISNGMFITTSLFFSTKTKY